MNGKKARALRQLARVRATAPAKLGFVKREVAYQSVDRKGRPETKRRAVYQLMYQPGSWVRHYRALKRAYTRSPEIRAALSA